MLIPKTKAERAALRSVLNEVSFFNAIKKGEDRVTTLDGHAALEFGEDKTVLFTQFVNIPRLATVRNISLMHMFLDYFLPDWKESVPWLNSAIAQGGEQRFAYRPENGEPTQVVCRTTALGIFLEVSPWSIET